jgi:1-acyl-sn-glycerol-3-phosphate acyltransferase/nucleoside-diphosphate-sugar epimerase
MDIREFYRGKKILFTGATSFLGKVCLEKILRDLDVVDKIFVIIRPGEKLSASAANRLEEDILGSHVFSRLRKSRPDFIEFAKSKLIPISGNLMEDNLGISEADRGMLLSETDVIIHNAAVSNFEERLEVAFQVNVLSTLDLLLMAKKMRNLKAFLFVSSTYVNGHWQGTQLFVEEELSRLDFDAEDMTYAIKDMKPKRLAQLESKLLDKFPNTHSFTKSLAEHVLVAQHDNVPLIFIRPSMIGATYHEPFPGWVDTLSATGNLFVYSGLGIVKFFPGKTDLITDIIPCDFVSNIMLSSIAAVGSSLTVTETKRDALIIHASTSASNPLRWGYSVQTMVRYWQRSPPKKTISPSSLYMISNYPYYKTQFIMKYKAPAMFYSAFARVMKSEFHKKQAKKLKGVVERCQTLNKSIRHLVENEWIFDATNSDRLRAHMSAEDFKAFNFDTTSIDWHQYINLYCYGLQRFVLKEEIEEPRLEDLLYNRLPSRDIDGHSSIEKKLFPDLRFALNASKEITIPETAGNLRDSVLLSRRVQEAIAKVSEQKGIPASSLEKKADEIFERMAATLQLNVIRGLAWFFRKVWRSIYRQVEINEEVLKTLPDLLQRGPVIIVPTHKSYIDFLIVSFVLFAYDIPVPHIAAGEDFLGLSFVATLLRKGGAFFLRRTFRGDVLYNAIFTEYVQQLIGQGLPFEFFIEGTRSRSGKLLQPKLGLVSIINDKFFEGDYEEISYVPITLNYERLIEAVAYARELLGESKKKESLENLLKARSVLAEDFGRISLKVGKPISLRKCAKEYTEAMKSKNPSFDPFKQAKDRRDISVVLGQEIVLALNQKIVWSPSSIVSSILMTYRLGISK